MQKVQLTNSLTDTKQCIKVFAFGVAVGAIAFGVKQYFARSRQSRTNQKKRADQQITAMQQYGESLKFLGTKFMTLQKSHVVVVGVGGVGSHALNLLIRAGVKKVRLVDFDQVSLSSLNRHAYAVRKDVGTPKVRCIKSYIQRLYPDAEVECIEKYATKDNIAEIIPLNTDYVVDCIDNLDAKAALVAFCVSNNIKILVSGGAGMKSDPTKMQIRDISEARNDELLSALRKKLAKMGIKKGVKVVFSYQVAEKELLPLNEQQEKNPKEYKVFDNYRIRIAPVLGTMPAIVGATIASYVLYDLCGIEYKCYMAEDIKGAVYGKIYNRLLKDQADRGVPASDAEFDMEDMYLLVRYIFQWQCVLKGESAQKHPYLVRWDPRRKASLFNLILVGQAGYEAHRKLEHLEEAQYPPEIYNALEQKWDLIRQLKQEKFVVYR